MRTVRVTAPDGRQWELRAFRLRLPPWRQIDVGGDALSQGDYDAFSIALTLLALPFTLVLIPLLIAIIEFPLALVRAIFSDTTWIEAVSHWPRTERFLWRTSHADAATVHAAVAASLSAGETLNPARAQPVEQPKLT